MAFARALLIIVFLISSYTIISSEKLQAQNNQRAQIGFTAGLNSTSHLKNFRFASDDIVLDFSPNTSTGYQFGLILRQPVSNNFRIQAEPSLIQLGAQYEQPFMVRGFQFETDSKTELFYFQLPLLIQLTTSPPERVIFGRQRPETTYHLSGGVFGSYLLHGEFSGINRGAPIGIEFEGAFSNSVTDQYQMFDGGILIGAGLEHGHISKFGFEARFIFSVFSSGNAPEINFLPQNLGGTFSVYYLF